MKSTILIVALFLAPLSCIHADGWSQDWKVWAPETVTVRFDDASGHKWSANQKRTVLKSLDGALWCQIKKPLTPGLNLLWYSSREADEKLYALIEKPSRLVETRGQATIVCRMDPNAPALASTTLLQAGLPATIRFRPDAFKRRATLAKAAVHEGNHLTGDEHDE